MYKLGPHVQFAPNLTNAEWAWVRQANIVKSMDYTAPLALAKPGAITIFRAFAEYQETYTPRAFFDLTLHRLQGFRPTYIEGLNEFQAKAEYGLAQYILWMREFVQLAHASGYKVAGFSFPTGCPEPSDWLMLQDVDFAGIDTISIHAYWGGRGLTIHNALRHRQVHTWLSGNHPPFIITECGRDALEGYEAISGVRDAAPGWKLQAVQADVYLNELATFSKEIEQDDYILGATAFTIAPSEWKWSQFGLDELSRQLADMTEDRPLIANGGNMFQWTLGFADYAKNHPEVDQPIEGLQYDDHGNAWQHSNTGLLLWHKAANKVYWLPKA